MTSGRGVRTRTPILLGEEICEYVGELISGEEGEKREKEVESVFRFFFQHSGKEWCMDATKEPERDEESFGRLVNHGRKEEQNARMKVKVDGSGTPRLMLCAIRNTQPGEEILYDYGLKELPWMEIRISLGT
ncbi:histone-lysine N-methyltransferase set-1-like [Patella vulgata]|uniref:histone-lysine N-methyltransferase set-1-like n=1 Tax=Patella vulgata TaxID=6465 RepID=UPI0024A9397E|nr:histone-lysine N-methyltransferase set-1-like [Patella vulgata]